MSGMLEAASAPARQSGRLDACPLFGTSVQDCMHEGIAFSGPCTPSLPTLGRSSHVPSVPCLVQVILCAVRLVALTV
jgi:hypothetical protein